MSSHTPVSGWPALQETSGRFQVGLRNPSHSTFFHWRKEGTDLGTATLILLTNHLGHYCSLRRAHETTVGWAMATHPLGSNSATGT